MCYPLLGLDFPGLPVVGWAVHSCVGREITVGLHDNVIKINHQFLHVLAWHKRVRPDLWLGAVLKHLQFIGGVVESARLDLGSGSWRHFVEIGDCRTATFLLANHLQVEHIPPLGNCCQRRGRRKQPGAAVGIGRDVLGPGGQVVIGERRGTGLAKPKAGARTGLGGGLAKGKRGWG
eukprot:Lithocolla_globosa_v1_NODE_3682_length_1607_cov_2.315722.p3 type:complete len:177 gc:universal NODE_3682_length_1607_cov_2.315722:1286-756(-)